MSYLKQLNAPSLSHSEDIISTYTLLSNCSFSSLMFFYFMFQISTFCLAEPHPLSYLNEYHTPSLPPFGVTYLYVYHLFGLFVFLSDFQFGVPSLSPSDVIIGMYNLWSHFIIADVLLFYAPDFNFILTRPISSIISQAIGRAFVIAFRWTCNWYVYNSFHLCSFPDHDAPRCRWACSTAMVGTYNTCSIRFVCSCWPSFHFPYFDPLVTWYALCYVFPFSSHDFSL